MKDTFDLEGLFNKEYSQKKPSSFSEGEVLDTLIRGSEYKPSDIIAFALGETYEKTEKNEIRAIFLTERGIKESEQEGLKEKYSKLNELSRVGKLADLLKEDSLISIIANLFVYDGFKRYFHPDREALRIEYHNLGGLDGKKRIIQMYVIEKTE